MMSRHLHIFRAPAFFILLLSAMHLNAQNKSVTIKAIPGLRYDVVRFSVKPGATVNLTLINTDDMDHNLVFTQAGLRMKVMNAALQLGAKGPEAHYIPALPDVLWKINSASAGESKSIRFTAPAKEGRYPYLCTYPGHGNTMYGIMYVTSQPLPPIDEDPNVPPARNADAGEHMRMTVSKPSHPYEIVPPYLMRTFMPDCGPAAIAVNLPGGVSYCWDAGACRLRYGWSGDFLKTADLWKRKGDEVAKIDGKIFFVDNADFPFRIGSEHQIPVVTFCGYRFLKHYPEFHFRMNDVDVYEMIEALPNGAGLQRSFRIPGAAGPIRFIKNCSGPVEVHASAGKWRGPVLELSAAEAGRFTITITKKRDTGL